MRWLRIARKDVRDAMRDRSLYGLAAVLVLMGGLLGYLAEGVPGAVLPLFMVLPMALLVPIVCVGLSYESVVGPRTDGSLQFLMALPYGRHHVVFGTYVGRIAVFAAALTAGFLALVVAGLLVGTVAAPVTTVLAYGVTLLFAVAVLGAGLGISTAARTTRRAGGAAFLLVVLFLFGWQLLPGVVAYALNGFAAPESAPAWAPAFRSLNPVAALQMLVAPLAEGNLGAGGFGGETVDSPAVAVAVLVGWATLVPLLGFLRFRGDDL